MLLFVITTVVLFFSVVWTVRNIIIHQKADKYYKISDSYWDKYLKYRGPNDDMDEIRTLKNKYTDLYNKWHCKDNHEHLITSISIMILCGVIISVMLVTLLINHSSYNKEKTLADIEETRSAIIDKMSYIEELWDSSENKDSREYQEAKTQAVQMEMVVRDEVAEFNMMINRYIAKYKSPWTNWWIPKEYTEIEKLTFIK